MSQLIEQIYRDSPDKGYRRINDDLRHDHNIHINDKRVLRICRKKDIKSTIKYARKSCTRNAKEPQFVAENHVKLRVLTGVLRGQEGYVVRILRDRQLVMYMIVIFC